MPFWIEDNGASVDSMEVDGFTYFLMVLSYDVHVSYRVPPYLSAP